MEGIFKFSASAAASEFCEYVQVGIDVYNPHGIYQVKPHSSPWFSAACAAAQSVIQKFADEAVGHQLGISNDRAKGFDNLFIVC